MATPSAVIYVALLRGINVGGNNMISMTALKASFERLGFTDVSTYINSGNILFRSTEADPRRVEEKIDAMLARTFDLKGKTVVRSHDEMARMVKTITKRWATPGADYRYNVIFLRHTIDSKKIIDALAVDPKIDDIAYCPGALLWSVQNDGADRSTTMKTLSKPMFKDTTTRNLNTTLKVFALMEQMTAHG